MSDFCIGSLKPHMASGTSSAPIVIISRIIINDINKRILIALNYYGIDNSGAGTLL
jgi:hypothetical protein